MRRGQAIVEVILGLAAAVMAVLALVQVASRSISNTGISKRQGEATTLAMAGLEWARGQRDAVGWVAFSTKAGTFCLIDLAVTWTTIPVGNCGGGVVSGTEFSRYVNFSSPGAGQLQAEVTVVWGEGGRNYSSVQTAIFGSY